MSGITSGVGLFSGVNTSQLIDQLLSVESRPKTLAQRRITQIQTLQAAFLDLNSRISALRTSASAFNTNNIFGSAAATSSSESTLTARATAGAPVGSYTFIVDRLVTTQQSLSKGFTDRDVTGVGLTSLTFSPRSARLDRDTPLTNLNGGQGVTRGQIQVTDTSGATATIDLSRVATIGEVISTINSAAGVRVQARIDGDRLVVTDRASGGGAMTIANVGTTNTATSLGIAGSANENITGTQINILGGGSALSTLNDGRGVQFNRAGGTTNPDLKITTRSGEVINIDLGDMYESRTPPGGGDPAVVKVAAAVTDLAGVIARINEQSKAAPGAQSRVTASIASDGVSIQLTDNTTPSGTSPQFRVEEVGTGGTAARDLGLLQSTTSGTINSGRLIAGMNTVLLRSLKGGSGVGSTNFNVTARDGSIFTVNVTGTQTLSQFIDRFNELSPPGNNGRPKVELALDSSGNKLRFKDNSGGTGTLNIAGPGGIEFGIEDITASGDVVTGPLRPQFISEATSLSSLNGGRGVGTGAFEIVNSYGERRRVNISQDNVSVGDLIRNINAQANDIRARVNNTGDGILIEEVARAGGPGGQRISITDTSGSVARNLNIAGTASGTGASNVIDGTFVRKVDLLATDTLTQVVSKLNQARIPAVASIISDGAGARPFRLSFTARDSGLAGAFDIDAAGQDLGLQNIAEAQDARVFFGSTDPARAVLISSSSNSITGVVNNVTLDLKAPSNTPVTLGITRDNAAIQKGVEAFITAFNSLVTRIDSQSKFDADTQRRGPLLGDSTTQQFRAQLFATITGGPLGVSGRFQSLAQVGITVGREGQLQLNQDKLNSAIQTDPTAVVDLFTAKTQAPSNQNTPVRDSAGNEIPGAFINTPATGAFTSLGIIERVAQLTDRFIRPVDGLLTRATRTLDDQIKAQNTRIAAIDTRLESRRQILQRQFTAMEEAIGKLQGQQSSIGNIRAIQA
ncbi:MAG: flagellar filament capping protein FliD [Phycisphaerales bacterium]|jgi:flagellar hook-associated protein 2|nr:flagellar filament capping protein FliD [Phycisphaeraceae bacterium]